MKRVYVLVLVFAVGVALPAHAQTAGTAGVSKASAPAGSLQEQIRT